MAHRARRPPMRRGRNQDQVGFHLDQKWAHGSGPEPGSRLVPLWNQRSAHGSGPELARRFQFGTSHALTGFLALKPLSDQTSAVSG